jgi:hypothetical protein
VSEVHVTGGHRRSFGALLLEVVMISVAVFMGLLADQWRESRHNRELAETALRNFRSEVITNQARVSAVREYHVRLKDSLGVFLQADTPRTLKDLMQATKFTGIKPVFFEHTAWDLSLATQALSYIEPELAYEVSKVYTTQTSFERMEWGFTESSFSPQSLSGDTRGLALAMSEYLGDVVIMEPGLLKSYDALIPRLNLVLGEGSATGKKD